MPTNANALKNSHTRTSLMMVMVAVVGVFVSAWFARFQHTQNEQLMHQYFYDAISEVEKNRTDLFSNILHELNSISAFVDVALLKTTRQERIESLQHYLSMRDLNGDAPGVFGIGLIERVPVDERTAFVRDLRDIYGEKFDIFAVNENLSPSGDAWVVAATYPTKNQVVLGMDLATGLITYEPISRLLAGQRGFYKKGFDASRTGEFWGIKPDQLIRAMVLFRSVGVIGSELKYLLYCLVPYPNFAEVVFERLEKDSPARHLDISIFEDATKDCIIAYKFSSGLYACDEKYIASDSEYVHPNLHRRGLFFSVYSPGETFWLGLDLTSPWLIFALGCALTILVIVFFWWLLWQQKRLNSLVDARTQALQERHIEAKKAENVKDRFLEVISHELRTPLNGIFGALHMFEKISLGERERRAVDLAKKSSKQLLSLVDDITDLDGIARGQIKFAKQAFSLPTALRLVGEQLRDKSIQADIHFSVKVDEHIDWYVRGDEQRLQQVLLNLTENAIKHTNHGYVSLELRTNQISENTLLAVFEINDTGQGLSPHRLKMMINAIDAVEMGADVDFTKIGISMGVVIRLIAMMGARLNISSAPGVGSTFSFSLTFPIVQLGDEDYCPLLLPIPGLSVLAVSSDAVCRTVFSDQLERLGINFDIVKSGIQALRWVCEGNAIDVILLDMSNKDMPIDEFIKDVHLVAPTIKIIGVSGRAFKADRVSALSAGMVDYLLKPLEIQQLHQALMLVSNTKQSESDRH